MTNKRYFISCYFYVDGVKQEESTIILLSEVDLIINNIRELLSTRLSWTTSHRSGPEPHAITITAINPLT